MFQRLAACMVVLSSVGCATVGVTTLKQAPSHPSGCKLEVLTKDELAGRQYESLCLLDARTGASAFDDRSSAGAIELSRPEACRCGADAILITGTGFAGDGFGGGAGTAVLKAIRWKVPSPAAE